MADLEEPAIVGDESSYYNWWPKKRNHASGRNTISQRAHEISSVDVYWFVEKNGGDVQLPASWRVLYLSGGEWKPVEAMGEYGLALDKYNHVAFKPVTAGAVRLEMSLREGKSEGISEWKVQ